MMNRRDLLRLAGLSAIAAATDRPFSFGEPVAASALQDPTGRPSPDVEIELQAAPGDAAILPGAPTRVWRFTGRLVKGPADTLQALPGSYLGPVIKLRRGQRVRVRLSNQLPEETIVHWHGLDVPQEADGHPRLAVPGGREYVYDFEVINRAGTYWYHPHPHMRTAAQVYLGLAGLLVVTDPEEEQLALPSGESELHCVVQDRRFDTRNQLLFRGNGMMEMMNGFLGDRVLVNGLPQPTIDVDAGWLRIRLLNGSNGRIYKLAWSRALPMFVIGGDGGLLERPHSTSVLTLAPAQRADLLVDLSGITPGTTIDLETLAFPEADAGVVGMGGMGGMGRMGGRGMGGMMGGGGGATPNGAPLRVFSLRTRARRGVTFRLPERLSTFDARWTAPAAGPVRSVSLSFMRMQWLLGGRTFEMTGVAPEEVVQAGSTHVWEFRNVPNPMGMQAAHPLHIHGSQFRILSRSGGSPNALRTGILDAGWQDTVLVLPGETVRVQIPFTRHRGLYLYHCHILDHEDMGMMRNFRVT